MLEALDSVDVGVWKPSSSVPSLVASLTLCMEDQGVIFSLSRIENTHLHSLQRDAPLLLLVFSTERASSYSLKAPSL